MVTTSNWHEIMNSVSHVKRLQVCVLYKTRLGDPFDILRSFSNDDELRRRERQKSKKQNKFTSASRFFVLFFAFTARLRCGNA